MKLPRKKPDTRVQVTAAYDVRSTGNGLIIGAVVAGFVVDGRWRFVMKMLNGLPAFGEAAGEFEPFEPVYGAPRWALPAPARAALEGRPLTPALPGASIKLLDPPKGAVP